MYSDVHDSQVDSDRSPVATTSIPVLLSCNQTPTTNYNFQSPDSKLWYEWSIEYIDISRNFSFWK